MSLRFFKLFNPAIFTGNFNVQDAATATTPVAVPGTSTFTQLTNDGLGSLTSEDNAPLGMTPLWDTSLDHFDFSQLALGDQIFIRADILVDVLSVNTDIELVLEAGIGEFPFFLHWDSASYKTTGVKKVAKTSMITMDTLSALDGTAEFQLAADKACNVEILGWNYIINRRS